MLLLSSNLVQKAISSIMSNTGSGHDKFPRFCSQLASAVALNMTIIFNSSIHNNIVPTTWKMAERRAIYKQKGSKTDPNNYRRQIFRIGTVHYAEGL